MYPALAVAEAINREYPGSSLHFVGSVDGFERPLVEQGGVSFASYDEVQSGPLHGVRPLTALRSVFKLLAGVVQSIGMLRKHKPGAVLLTGGWVGFPVALAAWMLRVPVLIFLPDIEPALSIKVLKYLAAKVAVAIPESTSYFPDGKAVITGYPIRQSLASAQREDALPHFGLNPEKQTLLVFGGSRGARTINNALVAILPQLLADDVQVIHVSGTLDYDAICAETETERKHPNYHLHAYLHDDMGLALAAADLVLSRSGAGVLGEFPLFGLPSILVPYPYAWRYQKVNADYLAERGAAIYMADERLSGDLYPALQQLFTNPEQLATMRANVSQLAQPNSAARVAAVLAELAGEDDDK
ncbi:MAG: UDP-N-acetylglucosamine--N-acetylmuramyl-(pentapeptide) pyrophosphoryl-undecaprenol N-acetylglucosamine transferase [Chloroflexota bacterium]